MLKQLPVHMLWVSGELSRLARLSLASFRRQGYRVTLWSYDPDHLRAEVADVQDAATLLPMPQEDAANMAYLTSLFRYRVLAEQGGIWADLDVVALDRDPQIEARPLDRLRKAPPLPPRGADRHGREPHPGHQLLHGQSRRRAPATSGTARVDRVAALNPEDRNWENVGPHMLSGLMLRQPDEDIDILPPETVDPVAWWNVPGLSSSRSAIRRRRPSCTCTPRSGPGAASMPKCPSRTRSLAGRLWTRFGL